MACAWRPLSSSSLKASSPTVLAAGPCRVLSVAAGPFCFAERETATALLPRLTISSGLTGSRSPARCRWEKELGLPRPAQVGPQSYSQSGGRGFDPPAVHQLSEAGHERIARRLPLQPGGSLSTDFRHVHPGPEGGRTLSGFVNDSGRSGQCADRELSICFLAGSERVFQDRPGVRTPKRGKAIAE